jgi:steroid delta-isomerase-like uncharacterized protein
MSTEIADRLAAAFSSDDATNAARLYADDAVMQHPLFPAPLRGKAAIVEAENGLYASFSQTDVKVTNAVATGDWVAAEVLIRSTNTGPLAMPDGSSLPATGRTIEIPAAEFIRTDSSGLIVEEHRYFDVATFMGQLGLMG